MNEKHITYTEFRPPPGKKKVQKERKSEQLVYSEVRTCPNPKNAHQTKKTKTESSKGKGSSVPLAWYLAVVILGVLSFFLLLTTGVLGVMVLQGHQACQSKDPSLNTTQHKSMLENTATKEEEVKAGCKSSPCQDAWSCCGKKCYFFSEDSKSFEESRKVCKEMGSTLLKIEDEKEMNFIQSQLSYFYWIGLSRDGTSSHWTWEDKSIPLLKTNWKESQNGNCAILAAMKIDAQDCSRPRKFICEKRIAYLPS